MLKQTGEQVTESPESEITLQFLLPSGNLFAQLGVASSITVCELHRRLEQNLPYRETIHFVEPKLANSFKNFNTLAYLGLSDGDAVQVVKTRDRRRCRERINAGYELADLKSRGLSVITLKSAGFTANDLRCAFSAKELCCAGFSRSALKNAGFSQSDLEIAGVGTAEQICAEIPAVAPKAQIPAVASKSKPSYRTSSWTSECLRAFERRELMTLGKEGLRRRGVEGLRRAGFASYELAEAGLFSSEELQQSGFFG